MMPVYDGRFEGVNNSLAEQDKAFHQLLKADTEDRKGYAFKKHHTCKHTHVT